MSHDARPHDRTQTAMASPPRGRESLIGGAPREFSRPVPPPPPTAAPAGARAPAPGSADPSAAAMAAPPYRRDSLIGGGPRADSRPAPLHRAATAFAPEPGSADPSAAAMASPPHRRESLIGGAPRAGWSLARLSRAALLPLLAALLSACGPGDGRTPLVVYSPHGRAMLSAFEQRFEELYPDIDVQWLDMGSQEVLDRLRSERANPQADVWWGAPSGMFQAAAEEGLVAPYSPSWSGQLPADAMHDAGLWHGTYYTPEVIAFNSDAVPLAEAPRDWDDVLDPKWRDKVIIRDPLASGTMRTIFGMIIYRSIRETGDSAAGFEWLRRLDAQTKQYVLNPTLLYQMLARQEGLVTLWAMPDIEELKARTNLPIDYVFPSSGTPLVVDGIALVGGSRHPEAAQAFIEFVGSTEGMLLAAREFFRLPTRQDIPVDSLPPHIQEARRIIVPEPMDWDVLQRRGPSWMRHWDEHIRGRGRRS
jgi:iron(III) transport system substrate-binding protein